MGQHNLRADDVLWRAAMRRAKAEGTTVTAVVVLALREYAEGREVPSYEPPAIAVEHPDPVFVPGPVADLAAAALARTKPRRSTRRKAVS